MNNFELKVKNSELLEQALTHSSCTKDDPKVANNERLEFFGDAVLKLVFSKYLFDKYPKEEEGTLTKYRARLISDDLLSQLGAKLSLEKKLHLGSSLKSRALPKSVLGDAVEALIAAIYLDSGYEVAEKFILELWHDHIELAIKEAIENDYKSILQEKIQMEHKKAPEYRTLASFGPDHQKEFEIGIFVDETLIGKGKGNSKKIAGQNAAKNALNA